MSLNFFFSDNFLTSCTATLRTSDGPIFFFELPDHRAAQVHTVNIHAASQSLMEKPAGADAHLQNGSLR